MDFIKKRYTALPLTSPSLWASISFPTQTDPRGSQKRIESVLKQHADKLGSLEPFLIKLLDYWGAVNGIVQRQEHGAQKEGEPLKWEDARRVVFQTMLVMYEIDRTLS